MWKTTTATCTRALCWRARIKPLQWSREPCWSTIWTQTPPRSTSWCRSSLRTKNLWFQTQPMSFMPWTAKWTLTSFCAKRTAWKSKWNCVAGPAWHCPGQLNGAAGVTDTAKSPSEGRDQWPLVCQRQTGRGWEQAVVIAITIQCSRIIGEVSRYLLSSRGVQSTMIGIVGKLEMNLTWKGWMIHWFSLTYLRLKCRITHI